MPSKPRAAALRGASAAPRRVGGGDPHAQPPSAAVGTRAAAARIPRGYGAMRAAPLDLDPRIDLTRPVAEQAAALAAEDGRVGASPRGRARR